jgi:hypothetical protein
MSSGRRKEYLLCGAPHYYIENIANFYTNTDNVQRKYYTNTIRHKSLTISNLKITEPFSIAKLIERERRKERK